MPSLEANFNELMTRIRHGRELSSASFEPIYYLVFPTKQILEVKRRLPAWTARLRNDGWDVHQFSIAEAISDILQQAPLRKIWLAADRKAPQAWEKTNKSLANALSRGSLQDRLEAVLKEANTKNNAIVLVTDLEALHPYLRIGAIESKLYGEFKTPTIFLYPGERAGKTRLKFLGFYPEDGNYRSTHVG
ncbi:MAG TPA: DUF1788 domain-containing protein [Anaerolineae bacterium]|nr:DUF1788 domain-containing protein [Anaerolineae bacterium]